MTVIPLYLHHNGEFTGRPVVKYDNGIEEAVGSIDCTKPYSNKMATVKQLCELYGDRIRNNPQWKYADMAETIKNELEIDVPRIKIARVRKQALAGVVESLVKHYSRVRDFGQELLICNPKNSVKISTTRLNTGDPVKFKRIYLCYHALKSGWKAGCRPVIGLDGCFLKTVTGGQLLCAIGRDGNNQIFPICYAVVESENADSWHWFIELMKDDLDLVDGTHITLISDQQKGLEKAVKELLPKAEHRLCTRHLCANFSKRFPNNALKSTFWSIACATYRVAHGRCMKAMERQSKLAFNHLSKLDPKQWCKAYFQTHSCTDSTDNNLSESFNSWILTERYMLLLSMLQSIQFKIMVRMREKRDEMMRSDHVLCPRINKVLDKRVNLARKWNAEWDGGKKFQVRYNARSITVNLDDRNCDCRVFDLIGIPCEHAIAAILSRREDPVDHVSHYYKRDMYLAAYKHSVEAMTGEEFWECHGGEQMLPPHIPKKFRGRPKRLRTREHWEGGSRSQTVKAKDVVQLRFSQKRVMHCSICGQEGRRKNGCPNRPQGEKEGEQGEKEQQGSAKVQQGENEQQGSAKVPTPRKRQKLPVRRAKGITINEPVPFKPPRSSISAIQTKDKGKAKMGDKGKAKVGDKGKTAVSTKGLDSSVIQDLREAGYSLYDEETEDGGEVQESQTCNEEETEDMLWTDDEFEDSEPPRRSQRLRLKQSFKWVNT